MGNKNSRYVRVCVRAFMLVSAYMCAFVCARVCFCLVHVYTLE